MNETTDRLSIEFLSQFPADAEVWKYDSGVYAIGMPDEDDAATFVGTAGELLAEMGEMDYEAE